MTTLTYQEYRGNKSKVGEYYGYPKCCIDQFVENMYSDRRNNIHNQMSYKASKGGFVPCIEHAEQILCREINIADLIVNRQCKTKFPRDNDALLRKYRARLLS